LSALVKIFLSFAGRGALKTPAFGGTCCWAAFTFFFLGLYSFSKSLSSL